MKTLLGQQWNEKFEFIKKGRTLKERYARALRIRADLDKLQHHDIRLTSGSYYVWKDYEELRKIIKAEVHALKAALETFLTKEEIPQPFRVLLDHGVATYSENLDQPYVWQEKVNRILSFAELSGMSAASVCRLLLVSRNGKLKPVSYKSVANNPSEMLPDPVRADLKKLKKSI